MDFTEWSEQYKPNQFCNSIAELEKYNPNIHNVWTLLNSWDETEEDFLVKGFHFVNADGYVITNVEWDEKVDYKIPVEFWQRASMIFNKDMKGIL